MQATREDQRAEYDLAAQQEMADWTLLMLILSGIAVLISGVGLLALLRTIEQGKMGLERAQEANRIASDIGRQQLRAYLVARAFGVKNFKVGQRPVFSYKVMNVGQTPAHEVRVLAQFVEAGREGVCAKKVRFNRPIPEISNSVVGAGQDSDLEFHFAEPLTKEDAEKVAKREIQIGFFGVISYRDIFKRRYLTTFKVFLLPEWLGADGSARFAMCPKGTRAN